MASEEPPSRDAGSDDLHIRTFLIADVRGYTLFTQERGDEAAGKLAAKFARIAREGVEGRGGTLLELRGDEALCVFASTRQAIRAAVDLQKRFVEETLADPDLPLTVGIGLDAGEAVEVEGGYRGGALNLSARLCGQARAGEILASREVAHLARRVDGVSYQDRGSISLKGLDEPVAFVRVVPEDLDAVERLSPFAAAPPPTPRPAWRRRTVVIPVALAVALVAISLPLIRSGDAAIDIGTNSTARIGAESGSLEIETALGQRPGASTIGFGSLWVVEPDRDVVARVDLESGSVVDTVPVGPSPVGIAIGEGSVWVTNAGNGTVSRISVDTNVVTQTLQVGVGPSGIAVGDGAVWVADTTGAELLRVDPASRETRSEPLTGQPSGVAFTSDGVWVTFAPAGVVRVDPATSDVTLTQGVGNGPTAVFPAFGSMWIANHLDGTVSRLNPTTGDVESAIPVGEGPNALTSAAGSLWVANEFDDSITEIDPATNTVQQTIPVGGAAASLAADGDGVWLTVGASASEHRGGTLSVSSKGRAPRSLDPAFAFNGTIEGQILSITNDGLMSFKKIGGGAGATVVPDLASALPEVSADGLTYRFPLRQGIRYSTGEPVRPEDFRHALERTTALRESGGVYDSIDGAAACAEDPTTCDLSDSIEASEDAVTIHLARPDPDLLFKLAAPASYPVPASIPTEDQGRKAPVPATGPYMIEEASKGGIELVRNPEFVEWSRAAQPDGFVDAISWRFNEEVTTAFERLNAGELDWMQTRPRAEDLVSLQATHPDQIQLFPEPATYYVGFDVRTPPFDDMRVRQALNYAIDRARVVELGGGPTSQRLTCQILAPNSQGYEPFCPYTLDPNSRAWSARDPDRARELVEAAGAAGERVTVWTTDEATFDHRAGKTIEIMRHVVEVLNEIGLRAELRIVHDGQEYMDAIYAQPPGSKIYRQVYIGAWGQTYPGAAGFIDEFFRCYIPSTVPITCTEGLEAAIDEAQRLQPIDPSAANNAWIDIEHGLVEDAVWAPLMNPVSASVFSDRVENVQVHPQWGILLSRLWVQ
jgi:peptide/nickel transport system substrate-binding protein